MTTFVKAIKTINPSAEFKFENDDIDNITWLNGTTPIAKSDIELKKQNYKQLTITINISVIEEQNIHISVNSLINCITILQQVS